MAKRIIMLKWPATCRDCGAELEAGARARYYGRGKVYGVDCHEDTRKTEGGPGARPRRRARAEDDGGGRCEDFPCCGHGEGMCARERQAERRKAAGHAPDVDELAERNAEAWSLQEYGAPE